MTTPAELICAICTKQIPRVNLLGHIAQHLSYFRHKCRDCDFRTSHNHEILDHQVNTGHMATDSNHRYMDRLCSITYGDSVYGTERGYEMIFDRPLNRPSIGPPLTTTTSNVVPEPKSNRILKKPTRKSSSDSSSDSSEEGVAFIGQNTRATPKISNALPTLTANIGNSLNAPNPVGSALNNNALSRKSSGGSKDNTSTTKSSTVVPDPSSSNMENSSYISESTIATFSHQFNRGPPTRSCALCKAVVPNEYVSHKKHVSDKHLKECKDEKNQAAFISKFIQACFPGAICLSDIMCSACGLKFGSLSGRKSHVGREHNQDFFHIDCPIATCSVRYPTIDLLSSHIKVTHNNQLSKAEKDKLLADRKSYNLKIRPFVDLCFPCPIPPQSAVANEQEELADLHRVLQIESPRESPIVNLDGEPSKQPPSKLATSNSSSTNTTPKTPNVPQRRIAGQTGRRPLQNITSSSSSSDSSSNSSDDSDVPLMSIQQINAKKAAKTSLAVQKEDPPPAKQSTSRRRNSSKMASKKDKQIREEGDQATAVEIINLDEIKKSPPPEAPEDPPVEASSTNRTTPSNSKSLNPDLSRARCIDNSSGDTNWNLVNVSFSNNNSRSSAPGGYPNSPSKLLRNPTLSNNGEEDYSRSRQSSSGQRAPMERRHSTTSSRSSSRLTTVNNNSRREKLPYDNSRSRRDNNNPSSSTTSRSSSRPANNKRKHLPNDNSRSRRDNNNPSSSTTSRSSSRPVNNNRKHLPNGSPGNLLPRMDSKRTQQRLLENDARLLKILARNNIHPPDFNVEVGIQNNRTSKKEGEKDEQHPGKPSASKKSPIAAKKSAKKAAVTNSGPIKNVNSSGVGRSLSNSQKKRIQGKMMIEKYKRIKEKRKRAKAAKQAKSKDPPIQKTISKAPENSELDSKMKKIGENLGKKPDIRRGKKREAVSPPPQPSTTISPGRLAPLSPTTLAYIKKYKKEKNQRRLAKKKLNLDGRGVRAPLLPLPHSSNSAQGGGGVENSSNNNNEGRGPIPLRDYDSGWMLGSTAFPKQIPFNLTAKKGGGPSGGAQQQRENMGNSPPKKKIKVENTSVRKYQRHNNNDNPSTSGNIQPFSPRAIKQESGN